MNTNPSNLVPELKSKAKLIKESSFFEGWTQGAPLIQKQMIFLVVAGLKPAGSAISGHNKKIDDIRVEFVPDPPAEVGAFLDSLGLYHHLVVHGNRGTEAFFALDPTLPDKLFKAESDDEQEFGILIGYPKTAVEAFRHDKLQLPLLEQAKIMQQADLPAEDMPDFCMSKAHFKEELEVLKLWWQTLQAYDLA